MERNGAVPRSSVRALAWHFLVVLAVLFAVPAVTRGAPRAVLDLSSSNALLLLAMAAGYAVAALLAVAVTRYTSASRIVSAFFLASSLIAAVAMGVVLAGEIQYSRLILLAGLAVSAAGLVAPVLPARWILPLGGLGALAAWLAVAGSGDGPRSVPRASSEILSAGGQILAVDRFEAPLPPEFGNQGRGGALTPHPDAEGYLLATRLGDLFHLTLQGTGALHRTRLPARVPLNHAEFERAMAGRVPTGTFRVADLATVSVGGQTRLLASHHHWDTERECFTMRVSWSPLVHEALDGEPDGPTWATLFESRPCLPVFADRGSAFAGEQIGGNMEVLPSGDLLVTVGDHQFDGWYHTPNYVDDPEADYGKTVLLDPETGEARHFTLGHRNPQGLTVDRTGTIWSTEHGPQGGDELNRLEEGGHYGYPYHTYGTEYGGVDWPPGERGLEPPEAVRPVYAWVPSIGISEVLALDDPVFPRWRGDLVVASLTNTQLWRVRMEAGRVVYAEPIPVGERIRDLASSHSELVLWTDSGALVVLRPATDLSSGAALFTIYCGGCHDNVENRLGPHLRDVPGRQVASASGYDYSEALARIEGAWTEERLHAFLRSPETFAPGNAMVFEGLESDEERSQVIEYLRSVY
jgi:cytochrome c2